MALELFFVSARTNKRHHHQRASLRVQITGAHGQTYHFKPKIKCRLQEDFFYYVVCRFLRPQAARSLDDDDDVFSRIEDIEYVILCSEQGAYGNLTERFDMATLGSASVESHRFFLTTWSLPRARGTARKERIDPRLVWTQSASGKPIQYTLPAELLVRKWGIRNGYGDTYDETLDEDTQPAKQAVFIDLDPGEDAGPADDDDHEIKRPQHGAAPAGGEQLRRYAQTPTTRSQEQNGLGKCARSAVLTQLQAKARAKGEVTANRRRWEHVCTATFCRWIFRDSTSSAVSPCARSAPHAGAPRGL